MKKSALGFRKKTWRSALSLASRLKQDTSGMAAIEMAFVFPVMLTLMIGLVDVSNGLSASRKVTITASTLGDLVSQEEGTTTKANLNGIFTGALETMVPFNGAVVGLEVYNFRKDGDDPPIKLWKHKSGPSCGSEPVGDDDMRELMAQGNDIIVTRTCYDHVYVLGRYVLNKSTQTLNDEMSLRPRKSLFLDCPDCDT